MTNSKTVDKDWVVAAQWRTDTATKDRLHTVKFIWWHCRFHSSCHFLTHNWLTQVNKSLTGNLMLVMATSSPTLGAMSASSFPLIPTRLGIQQEVIDLPLWISWLWSCQPGLEVGKISAGMIALPSFPSSPQASTILATDRCKHQRPVA